MPFVDADRPSIQLGLLKAVAAAAGFPVTTLHAHLDLAARLGPGLYRLCTEQRATMLGEWLFAVEAFGAAAPDPDGHLADDFADLLAPFGGGPAEIRARLLRIRDIEVPAYLDALVEEVDWAAVEVVGFTSTFQQNAASFALARRLKARWPGLVTVFGGANFDGEMGPEWVRTLDCVDLAVIGEGDQAFPAVLAALAGGDDPGAVAGVARRRDGVVTVAAPAPPRAGLDELPPPDYAEHFTRAEALGLLRPEERRDVWLPFESARGCWWGEKHHCTFCGLNGSTMKYRSKSAPRMLAELAGQARRYGTLRFEAVDNILDPRYLTELFPAIVHDRLDYDFFYEVKANLTREQIALLARAGVRRIQPGLESLSTDVLRLMRKGVRAAQNVNLLRWAGYYGVEVGWNLLWGFPGEQAADYATQAAAVPYLTHLTPPAGADRLCLERFSPLFTDIPPHRRTPEPAYDYVYPDGVDLDRVAYFFTCDDGLDDSAYESLRVAVDNWKTVWERDRPALTYRSAPGFLQIADSRPGRPGTYAFYDTWAEIYLACSDRPATAIAVRRRLGADLPVEVITEAFQEFHRIGLMFLDGPAALALALPAVAGR